MSQKFENIKMFLKTENNIKGILSTMRNIEKNEGISSVKIPSLTGLLKDFLVDEENIVKELIKNQGSLAFYLSKSNLELIDEIEAVFLDENALSEYKLIKLGKSDLTDTTLINTDIYLELIKDSNDLDLKYKLCFLDHFLMILLIQSNFDHEKIDLNPYKKANYEIKKLSTLIKTCADFITFMVENDKLDNPICINYLKVIKNNIAEENFKNICNVLIKSGYEYAKIEQIFTKLKEKTLKKLD